LIESWGSPLCYEDYYGGRYNYGDIQFVCDDHTGEIFYIEIESSACEVDGIAMSKPWNRLFGILGAPSDEGFYEIQGGTNDVVGYYSRYGRTNYLFEIAMSDCEGTPYRLTVSPIKQ
jgi:hypothetical protein